ncbi:MAG: hypothetical protein LUC93_18260 [Planctomycetaceae bacterium]|nr:hypothetical protein [Planctomycetaceae bacterium]
MDPVRATAVSWVAAAVTCIGMALFFYGFRVIKRKVASPALRFCIYGAWFVVASFAVGTIQNMRGGSRRPSRPPPARATEAPQPKRHADPVPLPISDHMSESSALRSPDKGAGAQISHGEMLMVADRASQPDTTDLDNIPTAESITREDFKAAVEAFGYLLGQQYSLDLITKHYPQLARRAQLADLNFKKVFGEAEKNIDRLLRSVLGPEYDNATNELRTNLLLVANDIELTEILAGEFIEEVELRAQGTILSPILETLLFYQFLDAPFREMSAGFTKTFSTKDHSKSRGLDIVIETPLSWKGKEGKRPNIIQTFQINKGRGMRYIAIQIRDMFDEARKMGEILTEQEIAEISTYEGAKAMVGEMLSSKATIADLVSWLHNVRNISYKEITMDRWPGLLIECTGEGRRLDTEITFYNRQYIVVYKHYMIFLQCVVGKTLGSTDESFQRDVKLLTPLFHLVANSLIIMDQY